MENMRRVNSVNRKLVQDSFNKFIYYYKFYYYYKNKIVGLK
jgi:hypothetical protein